jgi:hypothetical protein
VASLDSTVIDLCAPLFDWAHFRRTKSAVKLHCLLDHDGYLPSVVIVTEGRRHDVRVARAASSLRQFDLPDALCQDLREMGGISPRRREKSEAGRAW